MGTLTLTLTLPCTVRDKKNVESAKPGQRFCDDPESSVTPIDVRESASLKIILVGNLVLKRIGQALSVKTLLEG